MPPLSPSPASKTSLCLSPHSAPFSPLMTQSHKPRIGTRPKLVELKACLWPRHCPALMSMFRCRLLLAMVAALRYKAPAVNLRDTKSSLLFLGLDHSDMWGAMLPWRPFTMTIKLPTQSFGAPLGSSSPERTSSQIIYICMLLNYGMSIWFAWVC